jgi:hypothetical protein
MKAESPMFVHFQLETVGPFGRKDGYDLARRRLASVAPTVPPEVLAAIYQVTWGHPFYIYATTMRLVEMVVLLQKPLTPHTVQEAFVLETLDATGRIYNLCRYVLEDSLQQVRGETMPQAVLQVLAREMESQSLTQLAGTLGARPWFISRAGFTPEAEALARREGVMTSGREEMERLAKVVRRS